MQHTRHWRQAIGIDKQTILSLLLPCLMIGIVGVAFWLRVHAVGWGLPYVDHPDEPSAANKVLAMIRRGDWNPRFFEKPSLYYYLLRLDFTAYLRYAWAQGLYSATVPVPQTTDRFLVQPELFVWGRMLSVVIGTLTVVAVFFVGQRWWNQRVGVLAAALLAVSSFHVRESQYITVDVATTGVTLLALAAAVRLLDHPGWWAYALAGFAAGLAASAKYNAGAVALSVVVAHALVWQRASVRQSPRLLWAALWGGMGFLVATPYAALTFHDFVNGVLRQTNVYSPQGKSNYRWPAGMYLRLFWTYALQPLPFVAAAAGVVLAFARRDRPALVLLAFVPTQLVFFLAQNRHFDRNLLPIIPPLLLCAAIALDAAWSMLARRRWLAHGWQRAVPHAALAGLAVVVLAGPTQDALTFTRFEALPHSKVRAGDFVRNSLPHGAPIAVALNPVQWAGQGFITPVDDVAAHTAGWYRAQGYRYLVANAKDTDQFRYEALRAAAHVREVFPGDRDGQPGPQIEVLDLGDHAETLAIERQPAVFGGKLMLLGMQRGSGPLRAAFSPLIGAGMVKPGQALQLNTYWRSIKPTQANYVLYVHMLDAEGRVRAQRDLPLRANDYPTSRWQPGELVVDINDVALPADLPAGDYRLAIGVYQPDTLQRLPLADDVTGELMLAMVHVK